MLFDFTSLVCFYLKSEEKLFTENFITENLSSKQSIFFQCRPIDSIEFCAYFAKIKKNYMDK